MTPEQFATVYNQIQDESHRSHFLDPEKTGHLRSFIAVHFNLNGAPKNIYKDPLMRALVLMRIGDNGDLHALRELLALPGLTPKEYVNRAEPTYGYTIIMRASAHGFALIVELLLQNGADPHKTNKKGNCSYLIAAKNNRGEVLDALYEHTGQPHDPKTTLTQALSQNFSIDNIKLLIMRTKINVDTRKSSKEFTLLQDAISEREFERAQLLLQLKANPSLTANGFNAIQMVCRGRKPANLEQWLNLLLSHGADPNSVLSPALEAEELAVLRFLVSKEGIKREYVYVPTPEHKEEYETLAKLSGYGMNHIAEDANLRMPARSYIRGKIALVTKEITLLQNKQTELSTRELFVLQKYEKEYLAQLEAAEMDPFSMQESQDQAKRMINNDSLDKRFEKIISLMTEALARQEKRLTILRQIEQLFEEPAPSLHFAHGAPAVYGRAVAASAPGLRSEQGEVEQNPEGFCQQAKGSSVSLK